MDGRAAPPAEKSPLSLVVPGAGPLLRTHGIPGRMESDGIYDRCNELLGTADFSALSLLRRSAVKLLCTTDDPVDSLEHHVSHAASGNAPAMLPAWRPDAAMNIEQGGDFNSWLDRLSEASGGEIVRFDDLLEALKKRHDFFHHCVAAWLTMVWRPSRQPGLQPARPMMCFAGSVPEAPRTRVKRRSSAPPSSRSFAP